MDETRVIYIIDPRGSLVDAIEYKYTAIAKTERTILNAKCAGYTVVEYFVPESLGLFCSIPFTF